VANLSLETSIDGRAAVIALRGELDLAGAAELERELARIDHEISGAIVLDLRDLEFMDSSGLRLIAVSTERARAHGRRLVLVTGSEQVMRVFDITRMRERLEFVDDPREVTGGG
jgi:anti-anti-sigma factor